jgi:hypothetical protein
MEDPSGAWEWIFTIFASLFGLFLLVCIASLIWHYLIRRPATALRDRGRAAHHRLAEELPPPRSPEQAKRELVAAFDGLPGLSRDVRARLAIRARKILTREAKDDELKAWTTECTSEILRRWADAAGEVPRLRAELPPRSFELSCEPKRFVRDWNEQDWLHDDEHGPLTVEQLRIGPAMSSHEFVEWNVERWAWQLEQQVGLNCLDVLVVPLFAFGLFGAVLSFALSNLLAYICSAVLVVPSMWWWARARRRGYLAFGDD